jgi:hypothetical protein
VHNVPAGLDLSFLVGQKLSQVAMDQYQTILNFDEGASIHIEGACVLDGRSLHPGIDAGRELALLLGVGVAGAFVVEQRVVRIEFSGGVVLDIVDASDTYESFTIQSPDGLIVV